MSQKDKDKRPGWFKGGQSKKKAPVGRLSKEVDQETSAEMAKVEQLSANEVDVKLIKMLDEMNVTIEAARQDILGRPLPDKQSMLKNYLLREAANTRHEYSKPEDFIRELSLDSHSKDHLFQIADKLRISLTNNGLGWVKKFGELGGLDVLLGILDSCIGSDNPMLKRVQHTIVRCLKAFMNNKYGLNLMLQSEQGLMVFVGGIDPRNESLMVDLLKVTAAVCLVTGGHEKIMEAVTINGESNECHRFEPIMEALNKTENPTLMEACMQFVNAVLGVPDELEYKIHLRNEFIRLGLEKQIPRFQNALHQGLLIQLEVFETEKEADHEELLQRLHEVQLEFNDSHEVFRLINSMTHETPSAPHFLSILQHMLLIRDDYFVRPQYYKLMDECVSQIVLRRGGVDPDFHYTQKFELDVEHLIEVMVDKSRMQDAEARANELEQRLLKEEQERNKVEADLVNSREKSQQVEAHNSLLQGQFKEQLAKLSEDLKKAGGDPKAVEAALKAAADIATSVAATAVVPVSSQAAAPPPPPPPPAPGGPPPPPPPPGGIPPPPPPMMGGPPPPSGMPAMGAPTKLPTGLKPKKKYKPDVQMKRMNWVQVKPIVLTDNCFWAKVNEGDHENLDLFTEMKLSFGTVRRGTNVDLAKDKKFMSKPVKELRVLDPKSAQNISILLGQMKMDYQEIKKMVLIVDDEKVTEQLLQQLLKFLPGPEQMKQLQDMKGLYKDLSGAEQFCVVMGDVKRLTPRLDCLSFRARFDEEMEEMMPSVSAVVSACREVKTSTKFAKLLELILMMGNYMNAGSRNQQSYGFELNYLSKLSHTRATDQKSTLIHFLANMVEANYPEILDFPRDFRNVEGASRVSEEIIQKQMKVMEISLGKCDSELSHHKKSDQDKFHEKMKEFLKRSQGQFTRLQEQHKLMDRTFSELLNYFCLDRKKAPIDEYFGDLNNFVKEFERARAENAKIRDQMERQKRMKEQRDNQKQTRQQRAPRTRVDITGDDDKEGVLDDLLKSLSTGSAFDRGKKKAKKFKEEERKPSKLTQGRSRENSQPALTPPREVDTAVVKFDKRTPEPVPNPLRALANNVESSSSSRKSAERKVSNSQSEAKGILDRLRKGNNSSSGNNPDLPSTML